MKSEVQQSEIEIAKQQRRIDRLHDSAQGPGQNGSSNRQLVPPAPLTAEARKELEKTLLVRQMKTQILLLRSNLAEKELEVETLRKSQKGTKIVELSNEKEEFYLETLRLKQVVRELRESLQTERQKRAWDKKKNGAGEEIRKEVARLTSGYQNILKGIAPGPRGEIVKGEAPRPISASNAPQNPKNRPQSATKNRPPPLVVNASNATTLFHMANASGSSLMNSPKNEPRVTEPVKLSKQQLSRKGKDIIDLDEDDVSDKSCSERFAVFSLTR